MTMSSIGLPALNGFIGEFLILQGVFVANKLWAAVAASGIVLGAAYMLSLYQRTMFGKIENPKNEKLLDLNVPGVRDLRAAHHPGGLDRHLPGAVPATGSTSSVQPCRGAREPAVHQPAFCGPQLPGARPTRPQLVGAADRR